MSIEVTNDHLEFLDKLQQSGTTNMFAASGRIVENFNVDNYQAELILKSWMRTYAERNRNGEVKDYT